MSQSKPFHESAFSTQYVNPNRKYMRPSYSGSGLRKSSVPEIPNFKMPIPANVINLIPKSSRESTLKIFKAKEKEDRELGQKGDEPIIKKGNFYLDSIRKNDGSLIVEFLVDKGKKDYEKKKNQKTVGSMYVNDLWGKQYEVKIKRQTRINSEIKKVETQKRRPLHLKLEEAVDYFEQKNVNSARTEEPPKVFASSHRSNVRLFTDMGNYCDSEAGPQSERIERPFFTEAKTNSDESDKDEKCQKALLLPNIRSIQKSSVSTFDKTETTMCTSGPATNSRPSKDKLYSTYRSNKAWVTTESSESKMKGTQFDFDIFEEKSYAESNETAHKIPLKPKRSAKTKSCFEETKGAFDNLLFLCQTGINDNKEMVHTLQGVKEVWQHDVKDKIKRQKDIKRRELLQECQESMKRGKERHSHKPSM